jgi:dolichyl-phosphate-mannose--protein O-mannosyl transferase
VSEKVRGLLGFLPITNTSTIAQFTFGKTIMQRRQFNALAGQSLIALVLGTSTTKHFCTEPDCVRCKKVTEAKGQEPIS